MFGYAHTNPTKLSYKRQNKIPTYQYSKIRDIDLEELFFIEKIKNRKIYTVNRSGSDVIAGGTGFFRGCIT